jgi:hypothetical protein
VLIIVEPVRSVNRPTLSYANRHRPAALFEELFWSAMQSSRSQQLLGNPKNLSDFATNCCRWIRQRSAFAWSVYMGEIFFVCRFRLIFIMKSSKTLLLW